MKTKTFAIAATVGLLAAASAKPTTLTFTDIVDGSKCRVTKDGSDLKSTCDVAFGSSSIQGNAADLAALKSSVGTSDVQLASQITVVNTAIKVEGDARQVDISNEKTYRITTDNEIISNAVTETAARKAADVELRSAIVAEAGLREVRVNAVLASLNAESAARVAADNLLREQNAALKNTVNALIEKVAAMETKHYNEVTALKTADASTVTSIAALKMASNKADKDLEDSHTALQQDLTRSTGALAAADTKVAGDAASKLATAVTTLRSEDAANAMSISNLAAQHAVDVADLAKSVKKSSTDAATNLDDSEDMLVAVVSAVAKLSQDTDIAQDRSIASLRTQLESNRKTLVARDQEIMKASKEGDASLVTAITSGLSTERTTTAGEVSSLKKADDELIKLNGELKTMVENVSKMDGPKGDKGDKGDRGVDGYIGADGDKGDKGDKGDTGPMPPTMYPTATPTPAPTTAPTPAAADASGCHQWEHVAGPSTDLPVDGISSAHLGLWKVASTATSDLHDKSALFIRDYQPVWGQGSLHFWKTRGDVYCTTPQASGWEGPLQGKLSCDGRGVGSHQCGYVNGWILLHHGATYGAAHPCQVIGSHTDTGEKGNLKHLFRCLK